jgi:hypothetical protein
MFRKIILVLLVCFFGWAAPEFSWTLSKDYFG